MNKKRGQLYIASLASFSPEKNTPVWKDENGFIKRHIDSSLFFVNTQQYHSK